MNKTLTYKDVKEAGIMTLGISPVYFEEKTRNKKTVNTIKKGEVWMITMINGSFSDANDFIDNKTLGIVNISVLSKGNKSSRPIFHYSKTGRITALEDLSFFYKSDSPIGTIIGPFDYDVAIALSLTFKPSGKSSRIEGSAYATFERVYPLPTWNPKSVSTSPPVEELISIVANAAPPREEIMERRERELYYVPDPEASAIPRDDPTFVIPPGFHELPDGTYHMCPSCMEELAGITEEDPMKIMLGGERQVRVEKDVTSEDGKLQVGELEVLSFEGGEAISYKALEEIKLGVNNNPALIECSLCKVSGSEKTPPICLKGCPDEATNDLIYTSWHRGISGRYHYCKVCRENYLDSIGA